MKNAIKYHTYVMIVIKIILIMKIMIWWELNVVVDGIFHLKKDNKLINLISVLKIYNQLMIFNKLIIIQYNNSFKLL